MPKGPCFLGRQRRLAEGPSAVSRQSCGPGKVKKVMAKPGIILHFYKRVLLFYFRHQQMKNGPSGPVGRVCGAGRARWAGCVGQGGRGEDLGGKGSTLTRGEGRPPWGCP